MRHGVGGGGGGGGGGGWGGGEYFIKSVFIFHAFQLQKWTVLPKFRVQTHFV